jgi:hypothetical protein
VRTESTPQFGFLGALALAALLLAPLGLRLMDEHYTVATNRLGILFLILPAILVAVGGIFGARLGSLSRVASLIVSRSANVTRSVSSRTAEPSSVEFLRWYRKVVSAALAQHPSRRLVIVMDNLDRVEPVVALAAWSTMQIFTHAREDAVSASFERVWLLAPFDVEALSSLWEGERGEAEESDPAGRRSARVFLEKSFQLTFYLASPVVSRWRGYFLSLLSQALPSHDLADFQTLYRLYRLLRREYPDPITPRELKIFVNDLGGLHRIAGDRHPLSVQAVYAFLQERRPLSPDARELLVADVIDSRVGLVAGIDGDIRVALAALHFATDERTASELLLSPALAEAVVSDAGPDALRSLCEGFAEAAEVLEQTVAEQSLDWAQAAPERLARAASHIKRVEGDGLHVSTATWGLLTRSVRQIREWRTVDADVGVGLVSLVAASPTPDVVRARLLDSLTNCPSLDTEGGTRVEGWLEAVASLADVSNLPAAIAVPGTAPTFLKVLELASHRDSRELPARLVPTPRSESVVRVLCDHLQNGEFTGSDSRAFRMLHRRSSWDWVPLADALSARLMQAPAATDDVAGVLEVALLLGGTGIHPSLAGVATDGAFMDVLQSSAGSGDWRSGARALLLQLRSSPEGPESTGVGQAMAGQSLYQTVLRDPDSHEQFLIEFEQLGPEFVSFERLLTISQKFENTRQLVGAVVKTVLASDRKEMIKPNLVVQNYYRFRDWLGVENATDLIEQATASGAAVVAAAKERKLERANVPLFQAILRGLPAGRGSSLVGYLVGKLRELDHSQWMDDLENEGMFATLAVELSKRTAVDLQAGYPDALRELASDLRRGTREAPACWTPELVRPLGAGPRQLLLEEIRGDLTRSPELAIKPLLPVFGAELIEMGAMDLNPTDTLGGIFKDILDRGGDLDELVWMRRVADETSVLRGASDDALRAFRARLERSVDGIQEAAAHEVRTLVEHVSDELASRGLVAE